MKHRHALRRWRASVFFAAGLMAIQPPAGTAAAETMAVDLQLIAAADMSQSMDERVGELQRRGYARALRSQEVADAIAAGWLGRIAFSYIEWGDAGRVRVVVPWTLIHSRRSADAIADRLDGQPLRHFLKTSISHALLFSHSYFDGNGFDGRRVIDVSGNGRNNQGTAVEQARDRLVAAGIVINGLPIMIASPTPRGVFGTGFDLRLLGQYYAECVIGGPGSFMMPVQSEDDLVRAIKRKLVLEIARQGPLIRASLRKAAGKQLAC